MRPFTNRSRSITTWSRYSEAQESIYKGVEQPSSVRYDLDSESTHAKPNPFASHHDYDTNDDNDFKVGLTRPRRGSKLSAMKDSTVSTAKNLISNLPTISRSNNSASRRHYTDMHNALPETNREDSQTDQFPPWQLSITATSPGDHHNNPSQPPTFQLNGNSSPRFLGSPSSGQISPCSGKKDMRSRLGSASPTKWIKNRRGRAYSAPNQTYKVPNLADYSAGHEPVPVMTMRKDTQSASTGGKHLQPLETGGYLYARDSYDADRDFGEGETEQRSLL
ncbi:hypothetical protein Cpir12675_004727 [Ceratocystis pirilliformis]|uniref:Uncharacterized protein n=1 Tax=Ceratocystis pirilliformis TaxID=259994 RepID=A0ABR3YUU4_9PEZI